jgi:hypothetical protein
MIEVDHAGEIVRNNITAYTGVRKERRLGLPDSATTSPTSGLLSAGRLPRRLRMVVS